MAPTCGVGLVVLRVRGRGKAKEFLPAPSSVESVGLLNGVTALVSQDPLALPSASAFNLKHLPPFETNEARV